MSTNKLTLLALDEYVEGHIEAKKALITMIQRSRLRHYQKYMKQMDDDFLLSPMRILLIGASGTGKTHLLESLQKIVSFPLVRIDATQLNPAGSSGGVKSEDLKKMIMVEAMRCVKEHPEYYFSVEGAIDKTVVFCDEFDKLGQSFESSGNWNKHVQSSFLTLIEDKDKFAGVSWVFAGAFNDITQLKIKPKAIGFNQEAVVDSREMLDTHILKCGLIPEIVGRITSIIELDVFTKEQLYTILVERILQKKQMDLAAYHIFDIDVPEQSLRQIVDDCVSSGQGIRYMQRAIDKILLDIEFDADVSDIIYNDF